jgi:iron complex transport system ATP-binding protein
VSERDAIDVTPARGVGAAGAAHAATAVHATRGVRATDFLAVERLAFAYETDRPVLKDVSFSLDAGDFVGVVGPNGCGKSTLLDLVDGVHRPAAGEVLVDGRPSHEWRRREIARRVALVPQSFALDFDLSVREVVEMGAYCRGKESRPRDEALAALGRLGVAELAERRFPELSGGERQMVVLAQALVQGSPLLLLDEPASSLDVSHQLRLFDLLRELNRDGLTVLCVLHDLNLALNYFDKVLVLSNGEVAAWGTAEDALRPGVLEAVYGVHAELHRHGGRSYLTFLPRTWVERRGARGRVHVVCGGGTGTGLLRELVDRGFEVSAGVLNALDTDEVTGRELALPMAVEAPFTPITEEAHVENLALVEAADTVIVTDVPIGRGNERNLEAVRVALAHGVRVLALEGLVEHDFSGSAASLRQTAVEFVADEADLLTRLG